MKWLLKLSEDQIRIRKLSYFLLALGALVTFSIEFYTIKKPLDVIALVFMSWGLLPYLFLALINKFFKTFYARQVIFIASLCAVLFMNFIYVDASFIHSDAQNGLVFLFIPLLAILGVSGVWVACLGDGRTQKK